MPTFEAHITIDDSIEAPYGSDGWIRNLNGWKFSKIDGDPLLGPGIKAYLTSHHNDGKWLLDNMKYMTELVTARGFVVIREKIEQIVYDTKTGANEFD